jgi:hypothetical protein
MYGGVRGRGLVAPSYSIALKLENWTIALKRKEYPVSSEDPQC